MKPLQDLEETTRMPVTNCPTCGAANDAASGRTGTVPDPGDVSICAYCGEVCTFDESYRLVLCADETIRNDPEVIRLRALVTFVGGNRPESAV